MIRGRGDGIWVNFVQQVVSGAQVRSRTSYAFSEISCPRALLGASIKLAALVVRFVMLLVTLFENRSESL